MFVMETNKKALKRIEELQKKVMSLRLDFAINTPSKPHELKLVKKELAALKAVTKR
jgi:ribosomal protein L29